MIKCAQQRGNEWKKQLKTFTLFQPLLHDSFAKLTVTLLESSLEIFLTPFHLYTNNSRENESRALQRLYQQRVDGIIVQPNSRHFSQFAPAIHNDIPLVIVDREVDDQPSTVGKVTSANRDACYNLGKILYQNGYQNILTVSAHFAEASGQIPRIAGLKVAAADNGLSYHNIETRGHDRQWLAKTFLQQLNELKGKTVVVSLMGPILFEFFC